MSTDKSTIQDSSIAADGTTTDSSPRAFATTTGVLFQIGGIIYFFVGAIYWFISGRLQAPTNVRVDHVGHYFDASNLVRSITTVNVVLWVAGGLAMIAFGVGLQGEKRSSGIGAMIASGVVGVVGLVSVGLYLYWGPAWLPAFFVLLAGVGGIGLFLFAGYAASVLKKFPPPVDLNVVDDEWLEEYERERRARRGM